MLQEMIAGLMILKWEQKVKMEVRRTGHKDKYGKTIYSNYTVGGWFTAPWDEEFAIFIKFKIEKRYGRWWCYSGSDADNYLSEMDNLQIVEVEK